MGIFSYFERKVYPGFFDRFDGILDNREEKPPASVTSYRTEPPPDNELLQNLCKMRYKKTPVRINCGKSTVIFQTSIKQFRAWIALKLGGLLSFMLTNAFL